MNGVLRYHARLAFNRGAGHLLRWQGGRISFRAVAEPVNLIRFAPAEEAKRHATGCVALRLSCVRARRDPET